MSGRRRCVRATAPRPVAVCLEQSRGPLIYALLKYDFLVLYPVNPRTLSRFREAFSPSRHKDDRPDAEFLAELLLHHRERLRAWRPDDERTRTLRLLVEHRRRLVSDQTRTSNRLTALLKGYFPQVLDWFPDVRTTLVCDFLLRWPELSALRRTRRETLLRFFRAHNSVRRETLEARLAAIKGAVPLATDRAVLRSSAVMARALCSQMKATLEAVAATVREIAELCAAHEDYELFASLPGAGEVYASRLTAALGGDRGRWLSAAEVACLAGVAPVIERSGQSCWVRWRYLRPEIPASDLPRVRGRVDQALVLGQSLLRAAAGEGQEPSRGGQSAGLQVGADHLPLLAGAGSLRRGEVSGESEAEGVIAPELRSEQPGLR